MNEVNRPNAGRRAERVVRKFGRCAARIGERRSVGSPLVGVEFLDV